MEKNLYNNRSCISGNKWILLNTNVFTVDGQNTVREIPFERELSSFLFKKIFLISGIKIGIDLIFKAASVFFMIIDTAKIAITYAKRKWQISNEFASGKVLNLYVKTIYIIFFFFN